MDDPRAYFSVLGALDYMIPDVAEPVLRQIFAAKAQVDGTDPLVLDVGCSYTQSLKARLSLFPDPDESDSCRTMEVRHVSTDTVAAGF